MTGMPSDEQLIKEVNDLLSDFRGELEDHLGPTEQTTRARLLRIFEVWRQANLWRLVDLADAALQMFQQKRLVPGCTLTRGVFETVGVQYYVHKRLAEFTKNSDPESAQKLLMSALFGRKDKSWPEIPIQVLTAVDHLDKEFKGSRGEYDHLCEYAHPNLKGGFGTYVRQDNPNLESNFGFNALGADMATWGFCSLRTILIIGVEINNRLCAFHPDFVAMANTHAPNHPL